MATLSKIKKAKTFEPNKEYKDFKKTEYVVSNEKLSPAELKMFLMFFTPPKKGTTSKDWRLPTKLDLIGVIKEEIHVGKITKYKTNDYWKQDDLTCENFNNRDPQRVVLVRDI